MEEPLFPHTLALVQRYLSVGLSPVPRDQTDQQADQQHRDHDGEGEAEDAPLRHPPTAVRLLDHDGPLLLLPPGGRRCKQSDADGAGVGVRVLWFTNEGTDGEDHCRSECRTEQLRGSRKVNGGRLRGADVSLWQVCTSGRRT